MLFYNRMDAAPRAVERGKKMSLISKQIEELRAYAAVRKGELAKIVSDAADTIETLSEKLSRQYYNDGWIPVTERAPEESGWYIVTRISTENGVDRRIDIRWYSTFHEWEWDERPIAWMPLPSVYEGETE